MVVCRGRCPRGWVGAGCYVGRVCSSVVSRRVRGVALEEALVSVPLPGPVVSSGRRGPLFRVRGARRLSCSSPSVGVPSQAKGRVGGDHLITLVGCPDGGTGANRSQRRSRLCARLRWMERVLAGCGHGKRCRCGGPGGRPDWIGSTVLRNPQQVLFHRRWGDSSCLSEPRIGGLRVGGVGGLG